MTKPLRDKNGKFTAKSIKAKKATLVKKIVNEVPLHDKTIQPLELAFTSMVVGGILIAGYFVMKTNGNTSIRINNLADIFFIIGSLLLFGAGLYLLGKPFFQKAGL